MSDTPIVPRGRITDESIELMRRRIGYPNPTIRSGNTGLPWNSVVTEDSIRHFAQGYGDLNPLYTDATYGPTTRWGTMIAPPGYELSTGHDRSREVPPELADTRKALRGVQLYHSGDDATYYRPVVPGDVIDKAEAVVDVSEKESSFARRSVIVTNEKRYWCRGGETVLTFRNWFVHAERKPVTEESKYAKEKVAFYTDEEIAEIERAYDNEHIQGAEPLRWEDVDPEGPLPTMVKGPLTVSDLINFHMGMGWGPYGNHALRLGYENRKRMRGFYTRNEFNYWDVIQRVHWEPELARQVGVPSAYDIGPMRWVWLLHYCTNLCGDDGWVYKARAEFRRFNYMGDVTWIRATIAGKEVIDGVGPALHIDITGTNQRGDANINGSATLLLPSRAHGPVELPTPPPLGAMALRPAKGG